MNKNMSKSNWEINQIFIFIASIMVILTIMKLASGLIIPFLVSISITILVSPLLNYLEDTKKIPRVLSLIAVTLLIFIPIIILIVYLGTEIHQFADGYKNIQIKFDNWITDISIAITDMGLPITHDNLREGIDKFDFAKLIKNLIIQTQEQFSNAFLISFTVIFMLLDSNAFYNRLQIIITDRGRNFNDSLEIISKIKNYFFIKVQTSFITGLFVFVILIYFDIEYALLWGTIAFIFNFIPVIGSIIASLPVIGIAMIDHGGMIALWIAIWYIITNIVVGNILEPTMMSKGLGLSTVTIFVSMTFWGWMFGIAGMILSVPLTMIIQFIFEQYPQTKWVAYILSDEK